MKVVIRSATVADAEFIAAVCKDVLHYDLSVNEVSAKLVLLKDKSFEAVFIAEYIGQAAGLVQLAEYDALYMPKLVNVLALAVLPEYRQQGIGRLLMQRVEEWARSRGAVGIRLNSGSERHDAHVFYQKIGYIISKTQVRLFKQLKVAK